MHASSFLRTSKCASCIARRASRPVQAQGTVSELHLDFLRPALHSQARQASTNAVPLQDNTRDSQAPARNSQARSRRRAAKKQPVYQSSNVSAPFDYSERNPARAIERLSTLPHEPSSSSGFPFFSAFDKPIPLAHTAEGKAAEAARIKHNKSVGSVRSGVAKGDWQQAFEDGWVQLYEAGDNLQDRLDLGTSEKLVRMCMDLPEEELEKDWQRICKMLLVPVAKREVGNEHHSVVGEWVFAQIRTGTHAAQERITQFWKDFQTAVNEQGLAKQLGHPFELAQIPTNLFTAVSSAYCLAESSSHTLSDFLSTFYTTCAVPPRFGHAGGMSTAEQYLGIVEASGNTSVNSHESTLTEDQKERLAYWFRQFELVRIWARQGERGIRMANPRWRDRRNARAVEVTWERIKEAVDGKDGKDAWWTIDWRDERERHQAKQEEKSQRDASVSFEQTLKVGDAQAYTRDAQQSNNGEETSENHDSETYDEMLGFSKPGKGNLLKDMKYEESPAETAPSPDLPSTVPRLIRPTLPAVLTPALVSEFLHTLLHLDMSSHATSVWDFCKTTLGLKPTLIMWNALLLGHSHQRNPSAVEHIFSKMSSEGGVKPDVVAWSILINSYFRGGQVDLGLQRTQDLLGNQALRQGLEGGKLPIRIYNVIVNALLWNDRKDEAWHSIENMIGKEGSDQANAVGVDIYTVNIVLRYFSRPKTHDLAGISEALKWIEQHKLVPDAYTFTTILDALLRAGRTDAVERIHKIMENMEVKPSVATYGAMIDHLVKDSIRTSKRDGLDAALQLLRKMQNAVDSTSSMKPTEITYTSLIQGFARYSSEYTSPSHLQTAEDLHKEMLSLGIPPNRITYNSLMSANLAADHLGRAMQHFNAHRELKRSHSSSASASLDAKVAEDSDFMDENRLMSERIPMRTWHALIAGLVKKKHWGYAQNILKEMDSQGVRINSLALEKLAQVVARRGSNK